MDGYGSNLATHVVPLIQTSPARGPGFLESGYFVEMVQLGPWMEDLRSLLDVCSEGAQLPEKVGWASCG